MGMMDEGRNRGREKLQGAESGWRRQGANVPCGGTIRIQPGGDVDLKL